MLKPLTQEQIDRIIDTGIRHFADKGFAGANVNKIAAEAGVSVGVVYKYYQDKKDLFLSCVERSLDYLDRVFSETRQQGGTLMEMIENLIRQNQTAARKHPEYFRLYHQITVSGAPADMADLIEGRSARMYREMLAAAKEAGEVRADMDPALFAFFFDNLMMMLHFTYACEYYRDRYQIYCGDKVPGSKELDEKICGQLMGFIEGALGARVKTS